MIIYELTHSHVIEKCCDGTEIRDTKCIGYFSNMDLINNTIKYYRGIVGFSEYPNGFKICKYFVNGESISNVFVLFYEQYCIKGKYDEVMCLGVFASRHLAELQCEKYKHDSRYSDWPSGFTIDEYPINELNWKEGFVPIKK
jgi:hypothetical protein